MSGAACQARTRGRQSTTDGGVDAAGVSAVTVTTVLIKQSLLVGRDSFVDCRVYLCDCMESIKKSDCKLYARFECELPYYEPESAALYLSSWSRDATCKVDCDDALYALYFRSNSCDIHGVYYTYVQCRISAPMQDIHTLSSSRQGIMPSLTFEQTRQRPSVSKSKDANTVMIAQAESIPAQSIYHPTCMLRSAMFR